MKVESLRIIEEAEVDPMIGTIIGKDTMIMEIKEEDMIKAMKEDMIEDMKEEVLLVDTRHGEVQFENMTIEVHLGKIKLGFLFLHLLQLLEHNFLLGQTLDITNEAHHMKGILPSSMNILLMTIGNINVVKRCLAVSKL